MEVATIDERRTTNISKIGILGGAFDPIHFGHLFIAEQAYFEFGLDKVVFMPTSIPPHKRESLLPGVERYKMVVIATAGNPHFEVSRLEIDRPGISYTIDTLQELIKLYPGTQFYVIIGVDAILEILSWKDAEKVASMVNFIVAKRPGYSLEKLNDKISGLNIKLDVNILTVPALEISSTEIRERVLKGETIKYLLPENVHSYIYKRGFYS